MTTTNSSPADELYERMQGRTLAHNMMRGMLAPMFQAAIAAGADIEPALRKLDDLIALMPIKAGTIKALEEHLSAAELDRLLAFYRSPLGDKVARFSVAVAEETTKLITVWTTNRLLAPAFRTAGIDASAANEMGFDFSAPMPALDWSGVDESLRAGALTAVTAMGFPTRADELAATQTAALVEQGVIPAGHELASAADKHELVEQMARIYAAHFTVAELVAVVAFYATPEGARYIALTPVINAAAEQAMREWSEANPGALEKQIEEIIETLG